MGTTILGVNDAVSPARKARITQLIEDGEYIKFIAISDALVGEIATLYDLFNDQPRVSEKHILGMTPDGKFLIIFNNPEDHTLLFIVVMISEMMGICYVGENSPWVEIERVRRMSDDMLKECREKLERIIYFKKFEKIENATPLPNTTTRQKSKKRG